MRVAGGGGQGLAGGLVVGRGDQVGADVEHAPKVAALEGTPEGAGAEGGQGAVVEDAAGDEDVPDRVAVQRLEGDRLVLAADGAHLEPGRSRRLPGPVVTAGPRPEHLSSG
jgi:hypothetical protein